VFRRTIASGFLLPLAFAGCSFDSGGLPGDDGGTVVDASRIDGSEASDASSTIDAFAIDASTIDAAGTDAVVFDASPPDAQMFDAALPDAACLCDDLVDCTDDSCSMDGCVFTDICPNATTCNMLTGLCDGVLTFQQGVDGYAATRDTFLSEGSPDTNNGASTWLEWDADEPFNSGLMTASLLVFNQVFGTNADQVPSGATINSATLTVAITNGSNGPAGEVRESMVNWGASQVTWNSFGGDPGIQLAEVGPVIAPAPTASCAPCINVTADVDVQASLQAWSLDDSGMYGWVFIPLSDDGINIASSESASANARPLLTVDFSAAAP
jgi:hypothetical protein